MIDELLIKFINEALSARLDKHGWDKGAFAGIMRLQSDQRGEVGERLLEHLLKAAGVSGVTRAGQVDRTNKHWDIKTDDLKLEIKTATLGRNSNTFQHENIEKDRNYDALALVDIAPNDIYITWTAKNDIPWRNLHRRATGSLYKWDMTLNRVKESKVTGVEDIKAAYHQLIRSVKHAK